MLWLGSLTHGYTRFFYNRTYLFAPMKTLEQAWLTRLQCRYARTYKQCETGTHEYEFGFDQVVAVETSVRYWRKPEHEGQIHLGSFHSHLVVC